MGWGKADRQLVADVDRELEHGFRPPFVLRVEPRYQYIPAVRVHTAIRTLITLMESRV